MSTALKDFAPCYDFSAIETAVQAYLVAQGDFIAPPANNDEAREDWAPPVDQVAVMTAFQNLMFQAARPRVVIDFNDIAPANQPPKQITDANGILRTWLRRGTLRLGIVTGADYAKHVALRAYLAALADTICPMVRPADNTGTDVGINAYLLAANSPLQTVYFVDGGQNTNITPEQGYYLSQLTYTLHFAVRPDQWPGGLNPNP